MFELEDNSEYIPFSGQYYDKMPKCEYCNVNMNANCHAHKEWCPYNCNGGHQNTPIGDGIGVLITFVFAYFMYKIIKNRIDRI